MDGNSISVVITELTQKDDKNCTEPITVRRTAVRTITVLIFVFDHLDTLAGL